MIINVNGLIQYSKLSWGHFRKCRGNITKYFFLAKIYIIKQDIRLYIYDEYSWTDWAEFFRGQSWVGGGCFPNIFFHGQRRALQLVLYKSE